MNGLLLAKEVEPKELLLLVHLRERRFVRRDFGRWIRRHLDRFPFPPCFVVKNGSNNRLAMSGEKPVPISPIEKLEKVYFLVIEHGNPRCHAIEDGNA
jgi:hypothetical protein